MDSPDWQRRNIGVVILPVFTADINQADDNR
jgi:hypothetical protein